MEKQTGHSVLCLKTENGTEYVNQFFDSFFIYTGHQSSANDTPASDTLYFPKSKQIETPRTPVRGIAH